MLRSGDTPGISSVGSVSANALIRNPTIGTQSERVIRSCSLMLSLSNLLATINPWPAGLILE